MQVDEVEKACLPMTAEEYHWESKLPPRTLSDRAGIYGSGEIAGKYCGLQSIPHVHVLGIWQHGWLPAGLNTDPRLVLSCSSENRIKQKRFWVARKDQEDFARNLGFIHAKAIGLPVTYLKPPSVDRMRNSLLILPVHAAWSYTFSWDEESFAKYLKPLLEKYSNVLACLHTVDYAQGRWLGVLREMNIPVIAGARSLDMNALYRIATLFSMFETVLTNGFGSHWTYAQLFGAKLAVDGPYSEDKDFARRCNEYRVPNALSELALRRAYPRFFCSVDEAVADVEFARQELGYYNRLLPEALKSEFGWDAKGLVKWNLTRLKNRLSVLSGKP